MEVKDIEQDHKMVLARALSEVTGIPIDDLDGFVIAYELVSGETGLLMLSCCTVHASRILAAGIAGMNDTQVCAGWVAPPG